MGEIDEPLGTCEPKRAIVVGNLPKLAVFAENLVF
jgi:hypothetical protein